MSFTTNMKSSILFFLVGFLAFVTLASSRVLRPAEADTNKGICPDDNFNCFIEEPDECLTDDYCQKDEKCCQYRCGLKCMKPKRDGAPAKEGQCPNLQGQCIIEKNQNQCEEDEQCPDKKKCCPALCGKVCTVPEID